MSSIQSDNLNFILISVIPDYLKKSELLTSSRVSRAHYLSFKGSQGIRCQNREFAVMELAFRGVSVATYPEGRINFNRLARKFLLHPVLIKGPEKRIALGPHVIGMGTFIRSVHYTSYWYLVKNVANIVFPMMCGLTTTFATELMMQDLGVVPNTALTGLFLISARFKNVSLSTGTRYLNIKKFCLQILTSMALFKGFSRPHTCYPIDNTAESVAIIQVVFTALGMNNGYLFTGTLLIGRLSNFANITCYNGALITLVARNIPWHFAVEYAYKKSVGPCLSASITLPIRARYATAQIKKHKLSTAIDVIGTSAILMALGLSTGPAIIGGIGAAAVAKSGGMSFLGFAARKLSQIPSALGRLRGNFFHRFLYNM